MDAPIQPTISGIARPALYLITFAGKGVQHHLLEDQRIYFAQISQPHGKSGAWVVAMNIRNAGGNPNGLILTESVPGFLAGLATADPGDEPCVYLPYQLHDQAFNW